MRSGDLFTGGETCEFTPIFYYTCPGLKLSFVVLTRFTRSYRIFFDRIDNDFQDGIQIYPVNPVNERQCVTVYSIQWKRKASGEKCNTLFVLRVLCEIFADTARNSGKIPKKMLDIPPYTWYNPYDHAKR